MKYFIIIALCCSLALNVLLALWVRDLNLQMRESKVVFVTAKTLDQDKLWEAVQDWRVKNNLKPYIKDEYLCILARMRLPEIEKDWSHNGAFKRTPSNYKVLGENLARGFFDEKETLNAWLASASHAANLRFNFTHSCIQTDKTYAVQMFASY